MVFNNYYVLYNGQQGKSDNGCIVWPLEFSLLLEDMALHV